VEIIVGMVVVVIAICAAELGLVDIRADNSGIHSTTMHSEREGG